LACPACEGSGQTRRFLLKGKCSSCRGTGQVIHEPCDGSGTVPCAPCAGLGHQPGCPQCGSTGVEACYACFGSGLAPSASMLSHAAAGSFPVLLRQLPVVDEVSTGELLEHGVAVRRILAFLAAAHWSAPADSDESEHELDLLRNRLHLRAAFLVIGATSSITVDYRFLTIHRTAEEGYRVLFESHRKAWK